MGRFTKRTREYTTEVVHSPTGWSFTMSPGVTVLIQPHDPSLDWFAERLAETIQNVAAKDWV